MNSDIEPVSEYGTLDSFVEQYTAAYAAHRATYILRNPQPEKTPYDEIAQPPVLEESKRGDLLIIVALTVMVLASVIVSGSRTIDEFGGGLVGLAAFSMLEVGIVAYAYIRTKKHYDESRHQSVKRLTNAGMYLALAVTLSANLHATLKHNGVVMAPWLDTAILVLIAVSAPSLALISGDVLGMEAVAGSHRQRKAQEAHQAKVEAWNAARRAHEESYQARVTEWQDGLNQSWNAQKSRLGVNIRIAKPEPFTVHSLHSANEQSEHGTGSGYSKNMNAKEIVRQWLEAYHSEHPEVWTMSADSFHALVTQETGAKIGRTSAYNVRAEMKAE